MFAVPGWNIAAKSLVQQQVKPVKDPSTKPSTPSQFPSNPNKRKRAQASQSQGFDPTGKLRDFPSNQSSALSSNKKSKKDTPPRAEKSHSQRSTKRQKGGKASRNARDTSKSTGANAEPVVSRSRSRDADYSVTMPVSKEHPSNSDETRHGKADSLAPRAILDDAKKSSQPSLPPAPPPSTHLTALQAKMRAKLTSARFRHLNETLYTSSSDDALNLFTNSPDLFDEYHAGFSQQVKDSWPQNPVDIYIRSVKFRAALASPVNGIPLPRRRPGLCNIADLGCGDAPLARALQPVTDKLKLKLHSFDLHAPNSHVTKADISALPLHDGEVDLAIFCLSLMGTNWLAFIEEAWRVLRGDGKGEVWVAEVKSRFGRLSAKKGPGKVVDNSVGKRRKPQAGKQTQSGDDHRDENFAVVEDETEASAPGADDDTDLSPFIESFQRRGFVLREGSVDKSNKMFVSMVFIKTGVPRAGKWNGMKWTGKEYKRMEDQRASQQKRFTAKRTSYTDKEEIDEQEEGKLLKPCVYKLR